MFSQVLLTVDFDRTLTAPDSTVPRRNVEAIQYFIQNGGAFTVNTGRSLPMYRPQLERVPCNVPLLLYNGSAALSAEGELIHCVPIPEEPQAMLRELQEQFPSLSIELQGQDCHYLFRKDALWEQYCANNGCAWAYGDPEAVPQPFLKLALYEPFRDITVASMYEASAEDMAFFDRVERYVATRYAGSVEVFRAAPKIIDIHARGVSKAAAARRLCRELGRKLLVCVGDAENDLAMLREADYGFCPGDAILRDRFPNVCPCAEGAIADVIYEKIPEILGIQP